MDVFCNGIPHLCNLKSELTLTQIGFSIWKHSKRCVLCWNIPIVQFKVRVDSCINLIFNYKTLKKTYFAMDYHNCEIENPCWHLLKFDFPLQNAQKDVFAMEYRIFAISSQSWHLHKSNFPFQNSHKDVFCCRILHLCNLKSELTVAQVRFFTVQHSKRRILWWNIAFVQFKVRVDSCTNRFSHC